MKHVILTGAAGLVGSHLTDRFLKAGYAVTGVDNFVTGRRENLNDAFKNQNFYFVEYDVCQPLPVDKLPLVQQYGIEGVLHFACPASPVDFAEIPFEILQVDSVGTIHTVDVAMKYGARYMVASTSEIYGDPLVHPQKEDYWGNVSTTGPRACYDETKRFAEAYVTTAQRGLGRYNGKKPYTKLNAGIVRIFNTYGPRMRLDDGRVVPEICRQALANEPLTVHGNGLQTRSFCYVSDLVEGIFRLYESDEQGPTNIGNPQERTILDFAKVVNEVMGSQLPIKHLPAREDDPKRRCPDITRARSILGWEPKVSLEEGLKKTIEHFHSQLKKK